MSRYSTFDSTYKLPAYVDCRAPEARAWWERTVGEQEPQSTAARVDEQNEVTSDANTKLIGSDSFGSRMAMALRRAGSTLLQRLVAALETAPVTYWQVEGYCNSEWIPLQRYSDQESAFTAVAKARMVQKGTDILDAKWAACDAFTVSTVIEDLK